MTQWAKVERLIGGVLVLGGASCFINCSGQLWLFQVPYLLVTGWFGFLQRVLPEVTFTWHSLMEAVAVCLSLGMSTHFFLEWVWRHRYPLDAWRVRWSASLVALLVLLFCATLATVGVVHHVGWLRSGRSPMLESPRRLTLLEQKHDHAMLCYQALRSTQGRGADAEVVRALLRNPDAREAVERLHVVPLPGAQGEPGFIVFPRDPQLRRQVGGMRCGGGLAQAEFVHGAVVPRLLPDGERASGPL